MASADPDWDLINAIDPIRLIHVEQAAERLLWRELIGRHHYLGRRTATKRIFLYPLRFDARQILASEP